MPSPNDLGVVRASPLSEMEAYPNPFLGKEGITTGGGLALTGHPGIGESVLINFMIFWAERSVTGKSSFLWVVFNLRSAAGLPTLYISHSPTAALLWKDGKGYNMNMRNIDDATFRLLVPTDTWCLVDDNPDLACVPVLLVEGHRFIIHAASPGIDRMQWMKKVIGTYCFIMKPWDCGELIAGRQCQDINRRTADETQLANFHNLYGGSARDAYSFAHRMTEFETSLMCAFDRLQPDSIKRNLREVPSWFGPKSASQLLLSFFPVDDRIRTVWKVDSPSPHLQKVVLFSFGWICRSWSPGCGSSHV
ncbi:hypothetical protein BDZ89DRAFT_593691 [Hymenopellis radicata]|nr:hypothetical protein BDZ89DRAFT_593691 [Hymenopellis radicata]